MTLEILTSDLLNPCRHGFFTRKGGASSGVFEGLNCGLGSSDQKDIVLINRGRVADAMGVVSDDLVGVHQVHSADVVRVTAPLAEPRPKADAMVSDVPGLALSVLTADCQPVLFCDSKSGVIGAAHAGWRGCVDGVLENTVDAMLDLGAKREQIRAVIGPCISQRAYEVGPEFFDTFVTLDSDARRFFREGQGDRLMFDLPGFGLSRLKDMGVVAQWIGACTYSEPARFFSYRRTTHAREVDYGRLIACIRL